MRHYSQKGTEKENQVNVMHFGTSGPACSVGVTYATKKKEKKGERKKHTKRIHIWASCCCQFNANDLFVGQRG